MLDETTLPGCPVVPNFHRAIIDPLWKDQCPPTIAVCKRTPEVKASGVLLLHWFNFGLFYDQSRGVGNDAAVFVGEHAAIQLAVSVSC